MLIILMYHQIVQSQNSQNFILFQRHITNLMDNYNFVLPGDRLCRDKINLCLTFDDAYYDFYYYIYPWLVAQNIPAVLGVPTGFIKEDSLQKPATRLEVTYPYGLSNDRQHLDPLCTWQEISKMADGKKIMIASHGHRHADLSISSTDVMEEILYSKELLEDKLGEQVNTFIYPYGKFTKDIQKEIAKHYTYVFRIGSASNKDWCPVNKLLYRIDARDLWQDSDSFIKTSLMTWRVKYLLNKIRFK